MTNNQTKNKRYYTSTRSKKVRLWKGKWKEKKEKKTWGSLCSEHDPKAIRETRGSCFFWEAPLATTTTAPITTKAHHRPLPIDAFLNMNILAKSKRSYMVFSILTQIRVYIIWILRDEDRQRSDQWSRECLSFSWSF
jgi:hypothetical protein